MTVGQVINNCNNYLILRQNNPQDAEFIANIIGTEDSFQLTSQVDQLGCLGGNASVRQTQEFMVHPDIIKRLTIGQAVYISKTNFNLTLLALRYRLV